MSGTTFPDIIKDTEIQDNGVASLRTAPNRGGTWGQNGLTAGDLQKKFDALPKLIAERLNALIASIASGTTPESEARKAAIKLLDDAIAAEASARATAITAEASARAEEDAKKADKTTVDAELAKKVDTPQNTSGKDRVMVSRAGGAVQTWSLSDTPLGNAVVKYGADKTLSSADAVTDDNTVTLRQLKAEIAKLVNGAPDTLDTLKEIADALAEGDSAIESLLSTITTKTAEAKAEANRYTDEKVAGKLDIPTGNSLIWSTDQNGNLVYQTWSQSASGRSLVRRTPYGKVKVSDAVDDDDATSLGQMNAALSDKASSAELVDLASRVAELEQNGGGGGSPTYTDSEVAYRKLVPSNALGVAAITEIGGATYRFKNLYDPSALAGQEFTAEDGSTLSASDDGAYISVSPYTWEYGVSVSTAPVLFRDIFPEAKIGKKYSVRYNTQVGNSGYGYGSGSIDPIWDGFTLTESIYNNPLEFTNGWDYDEMGNQYATWCDFYDIELIELNRRAGVDYDTKVTSVEVTGKNLWPAWSPQTFEKNGVTVTRDENGVYTLNGTCTANTTALNANLYVPQGKYYFLRDFAEGNFPQDEKVRVSAGYPWDGGMHLSVSNSGDVSMAFGKHDSPTEQVSLEIRLYKGHTYNNCKLYPMLISGVTEPKKFIPARKQVYEIPTAVQSLPAYGKWKDAELHNRIVFREDRVVYEQRVDTSGQPLSPFVETDITSALAWDGFIDVEEGGFISFENQYSDPVPSTIVYQTK